MILVFLSGWHLLLAAPAPSAASQPVQGSQEWKQAYLVSRGWEAFAAHRYAESEQLFKSVLKSAPTNEIALIHLSVICNERGDREAAAGYLRTAVKAHPQSFAAQFHLGATWLALKRYEEAAAAFHAAARLNETNIDSRVNMGDAYELIGRGEDARKAYGEALAIDPKSGWAHRQLGYSALKANDMGIAAQHLVIAKATFPKDGSLALNLGHAHSALGNDAAALEAYQQAVTLTPGQSTPYVFVGTTLERMGKKPQAEKAYRQAVRVQPMDPLARTLLGNLMRADNRPIQARKEYEAALRANKNFVWALTQLGTLLLESGDTAESARLLKRALQLAPDNDDVEVTLGDIASLKNLYEEAAIRYRRVLARSPRHLAATVKLAYMLRAKGRLEDARKQLERAVDQHPRSAWALISLGDTLRLMHDNVGAEALYKRALDIDPKSTWAQRQLGYVYFELHKPLQAREALLSVESAYATESEIPLILGHVARLLKEYDAARAYYTKAMKLAPKNALSAMFMGVLEQELGQYSEAIMAYDRATALDPKLTQAFVLRGDSASLLRHRALEPVDSIEQQPQPSTLPVAASLPFLAPSSAPTDTARDAPLAEKMYEVARDAYRKALVLSPQASWPSRQLGFLEFYHDRLEQARPLLIAASADFPDDVEINLARGHIERARKHDDDALPFFEQAARLSPEDVRGYLFAAILHRDNKRYAESYIAATRAIAAKNTSSWAYYERALTVLELRRPDLALLDAERATKLDKKARGAWLLTGRLSHMKRDYDRALAAYGVAMQLDPTDPQVQLAYASALRDRARTTDLVEAAGRVERAVNVLGDEAFARLVSGHVFSWVTQVEQRDAKLAEGVKGTLVGKDVGLTFSDIATRHLLRAVEISPDDSAARLSAARSLVAIHRVTEARALLEPLLESGKDKCPEREWDVSWAIEKNRAELLPSITNEQSKDATQTDFVAIAYLLAGDLAFESKSWKPARLLYACAIVHEPNRAETHLRLGSAHEADGFVRLAEEHFVVARLLSDLSLSRPAANAPAQPASEPASLPASLPSSAPTSVELPAAPAQEIDPDRKRELTGIFIAASEAIGRLRKEGGYPVAKVVRLSAETSYRSYTQPLDLVQRSAEILSFNGGQPGGTPLLALNVPRTFSTRAIASFHNPQWRVVPRFELEYRFFYDQNSFVSDQQTLQDRTGHQAEVRAAGVFPLRVPNFELAYSLGEAFTYAASPLRDELHATTTLTLRATITQLGSVLLQLGYDSGHYLARASTAQNVVANSLFGVLRVEPMLRKYKLETALAYRIDAAWLKPIGSAWNHAIDAEIGSRIGGFYFQEQLRFGFAASDLVPSALTTVFSYALKTRGGYVFGQQGSVLGSFTLAGTGAAPTFSPTVRSFDYVAVGVEGNYNLVWPKVPGVTHTGFQFSAGYELRVAYNVGRLDHFVNAGISFAR